MTAPGASPAGPQARRAGPVVVLTGPPAAGKTSVGRMLSGRLGTAFVDTDAEIEAAAGKPVGDIFVDDGETAFRDLEREAARRALAADGAVVALGSGAVLDPEIQRSLAGRPVAYLDAGFAAIAKRLGLDRPRVVIPGNPRGRLRGMLEERRHLYERLAAITVPADDLAPEEIADEIEAWLRADGPQPDGPRTGAQPDGAQPDGAQPDGAQAGGAQADGTQRPGQPS